MNKDYLLAQKEKAKNAPTTAPVRVDLFFFIYLFQKKKTKKIEEENFTLLSYFLNFFFLCSRVFIFIFLFLLLLDQEEKIKTITWPE